MAVSVIGGAVPDGRTKADDAVPPGDTMDDVSLEAAVGGVCKSGG